VPLSITKFRQTATLSLQVPRIEVHFAFEDLLIGATVLHVRYRVTMLMITSTIRVLILVPVFFALMKERALRRGTLQATESNSARTQSNTI
jgi:hypothetical protein